MTGEIVVVIAFAEMVEGAMYILPPLEPNFLVSPIAEYFEATSSFYGSLLTVLKL